MASANIGELVMESLRSVDPVGYVRYASVYRDFGDPSDFAQFIETSALED
jgi:transcriptional repressor NrdR